MKYFLAAGVVLTLGCLLAAQEPAGQQPIFRGRGDFVRVFATVLDRDGRLVPNLTQQDFLVKDDGKPQPITLFDNAPQPIRMVVMLDVSGSMEGNLPLLREASNQLFDRLRPDDLARIGTFGRDVTISDTFTHDADALRGALPDHIAPDAPTPLWRAVNEAMNTFDKNAQERRVVLVLTDGKDSGPIDFRHRAYSQADDIDRARDEDVMIYAVGMRSRPQRGNQQMMPGMMGPGGLQAALTEDLPDPGLARVAEETGGGYTEIKFGQDLGAAFARVADELHSQYLIGYEPPKRDGKVHKVEVDVTQKGLKPRAKKSYVAPK
jgi:Ca-activated chloride channel family protein